MLVVTDSINDLEVVENEDNREEQNELQMIKADNEIQTISELSINSVGGLTNLGMMKIKGNIGKEAVVVLIDCGLTHNFIAERLVLSLKLPIVETSNYGVILGSGLVIKGKGICNVVELVIGELIVRGSFLPLELGGVDVILGMQWLNTLG